jgi:response regulator RpfG family c-di-GMP phosphodiesterase
MTPTITILYVDDEPLNLMLFETMFRKKYKVLKAESGFTGLQILENTKGINVIISDMKMPGMTGIEFIQKAHALHPEILYYILTGYDITPEIQLSLKEGLITEYFQKPFNMQLIDKSISSRIFPTT